MLVNSKNNLIKKTDFLTGVLVLSRPLLTDPRNRHTFVTGYRYDSWGRMKELVHPDGDKVLYHYDEGGQIKAITGDKGGVNQSYISSFSMLI